MRSCVWALVATTLQSFAAEPQWTVTETYDDFDDVTRVLAASPEVQGQPYGQSRLYVRCEKKSGGDNEDIDVFATFGYLNPVLDVEVGSRSLQGTRLEYIWTKLDSREKQKTAVELSKARNALFLLGPPYFIMLNSTADNPVIDTVALVITGIGGSKEQFSMRVTYYEHGMVTIPYPLVGVREAVARVASVCPSAINAESEMGKYILTGDSAGSSVD